MGFQLLAIKPMNTTLLSARAMDKTMKISGNNRNHALIHNRKSVPAELLKLSRENEAATGFSTSALTSTNHSYQIKDTGVTGECS